jgi:type I restriction enzyme S subunit
VTKKVGSVETFKDDLPPGWSSATIGELVGKNGIFKDGDWVESKDQDPDGDVRLIQLADIGDGKYRDRSSRFLTYEKAIALRCTFLEKGDVLVARMPDPLGRACLFPGDKKKSVTVVDVCVVRPEDKTISKRWLMYFINAPAFRSVVASLQTGSTRKRISRKNLAKISFPVPPSNEQQRIVAEIEKQFSRLDEAVENLKRVKANLKRYKAAVLKAAVEGKLTEEWRKAKPNVEPADKLLDRILTERRKKWEQAELAKMKANGKSPKDDKWKKKYKTPALPKDVSLPNIPEEWCWVKTEILAADEDNAICAGPFGTIFKAKDFRPEGIPIIFLRHVAPGKYLTHKPGFMDVKKWEELFQPYSVFGGELLVTKLGEPPGVCAIYPENVGPAMVTPDVIKMSVNDNYINSKYLMHYFNSQVARHFATGLAFGTTRLRLTLPIFRNLFVPLAPLKEQNLIVDELERILTVVVSLEEEVRKKLYYADRLRQAILKKAFSGKLVPQEETADNPPQQKKAI